jgi:hypothetical protein
MIIETAYEHQRRENTHCVRKLKQIERSKVFSTKNKLLLTEIELYPRQRRIIDQRRENSVLTYGKVFICLSTGIIVTFLFKLFL